MWLRGTGISHVGAYREHQEDAWLLELDGDMALTVVADGMGASTSGRPAADLAVDRARRVFGARAELLASVWWKAEHRALLPDAERSAVEDHVRMLWRSRRAETQGDVAVLATGGVEELARLAVEAGNRAIWNHSHVSPAHRGQGTTAEVAVFDRRHVGIGHVGDSRSYRVRSGAITLLTRDHSLINDYLTALPDLTPEQIDELPRNVITRALGMQETVTVDMSVHALDPGDRFLFCTDGLWRASSDEALLAAVERHGVDAARALVDEVAARADDNVTALVVEIA